MGYTLLQNGLEQAAASIGRDKKLQTSRTVFLQSSVCQGNHINPATSDSNKENGISPVNQVICSFQLFQSAQGSILKCFIGNL